MRQGSGKGGAFLGDNLFQFIIGFFVIGCQSVSKVANSLIGGFGFCQLAKFYLSHATTSRFSDEFPVLFGKLAALPIVPGSSAASSVCAWAGSTLRIAGISGKHTANAEKQSEASDCE